MKKLTWTKILPDGVSKAEHYNTFATFVKQSFVDLGVKGKNKYIVCGSDMLPVVKFCDTFKSSNIVSLFGSYVVGTIEGINVVFMPKISSKVILAQGSGISHFKGKETSVLLPPRQKEIDEEQEIVLKDTIQTVEIIT